MQSYPGDLLLHLESFLALLARVRSGGPGAFDRAAAELHVDRSVLRRRIQTLTAWVGADLLRGRGASLQLTSAGLRLAGRAERLVAAARELPAVAAAGPDRVVIACTGTVTTELLPRTLLDLERGPARLQLAVRRAGGALCESLVRGGEADLGVVRGGTAIARDLEAAHLADDRLWLVAPRSHALLARRRIGLADIASAPLVLYGEASRTRARVMERLAPLGASIRVEVDGKAAALQYVRLGFGVAFISLLPGQRIPAPHAARDVTALFGKSGFFAIARRPRWSDPTIRRIVDSLVRHATG
ncbi:MAG TPA: LysR family transcriptional regulator [Kofleriaceae bacterium]|nr:LysR family transcriptional regulator [Kofleriaceae bacterium]